MILGKSEFHCNLLLSNLHAEKLKRLSDKHDKIAISFPSFKVTMVEQSGMSIGRLPFFVVSKTF